MTVDGVISRVAAGLSVVAILGMGVHLISRAPHPEPQAVAHATVPDVAFIETGDAVDIGVAPAATMVDSLPVSPMSIAVEPLVIDEQPLQAGDGLDGVLASLSTQINNSLGPSFLNYSISIPLSYGQKMLQEIPSMLESPAIADLPADALPVDAVPSL